MPSQALKARLLSGTVLTGVILSLGLAAPSFAQVAPAGTTPPAPDVVSPDPATVQPNSDDENQVGSPAEETGEEVEAVVVTGSRIRRDPTNAPAPLIQLNREEILESGEANVIDALVDVPALSASTVAEDTTGSLNIGGLSLLNLRNLGSVRTLVLVDGRRHVGSNPGTLSVDVDTIPSLLIESTEIVTGGQSALYGADAVTGVVNFILRRNFEGLELDGSINQINQNGELNGRISGLAGVNLLNDRLNVYAFAEYQKSEEVLTINQDFREAGFSLLNVDSDPSPSDPDGVLDNILIRDARRIDRPIGGSLTLANQVRPSTGFVPGTSRVADPDIPPQTCPTTITNALASVSANCFAINPTGTSTFVFDANGVARQPNYGTVLDPNGYSRTIISGGDPLGYPANTLNAGATEVPESEATRFQGGVNFDITEDLQFFAEAKYVEEETFFQTQPTFFDITLAEVPDGRTPQIFSNSVFNIGLDNAYLDPAVREQIRTNQRAVYDLRTSVGGRPNPNFGNFLRNIADPRARFQVFGTEVQGVGFGGRLQRNDRTLERYVAGLRGDRERLGFIEDFSYEVGYTYGKVENQNREGGSVDVVRFQNQIDAVVDVNNETGRGANSIVCRVQLLAARGQGVYNPQSNGLVGVQTTATSSASGATIPPDTFYNANDPDIRDCVPARVFGTGGFSAEARAYSNAEISVLDTNEQSNLLAFASGSLFGEFIGAGPVGVAVGYEYREEKTSGIGRSATTRGRQLFLNTGPDFPEATYDVNELFAEVQIPLLRDLPFAERLEVSGAYRTSEYSTVGRVETYSLQGQYRPIRDILFRATYGEAVRIPNLEENFGPPTQTFANGFSDPCDALSINNVADPVVRQNRITNCTLLLGAGYNPDFDSENPTRLIYTSGVPGFNAGNLDLEPEQSRSYTFSVSLQPRFIPRFSAVFDFYDISVTNVIAAVSAEAAAFQCVSGAALNQAACDTIVRNGPSPGGGGQAGQPFAVVSFTQLSRNYAATDAKGIDFAIRYALELEEVIGRAWGRLDYSIRGNYLIRQEDFFNVEDPGEAEPFDATVGLPRVRFRSRLTYTPIPPLSLTWAYDFQTSQEIADSDFLLQDPDNREPRFLTTGAFHQHDFTARYRIRDNITVRGGVVNAFDEEPAPWLGSNTSADNFDLFGRRYFLGLNVALGAAAD